jgi:hypothetical protein
MSLQKIKITGYTDEEFLDEIDSQEDYDDQPCYEAMINPDTITWQRTVNYNEEQASGTSSASQTYLNTPSETLSFDIVIDCTGIVDPDRTDLMVELDELQDIIYTYDGFIHRPNYVKIQWGQGIIFNGVITSLNTTFSLFRPDGSPIRAKVSLSFSEYISPETLAEMQADESPDMTHLVSVVQGMSLPQLCRKVWKNSFYYVQVARYNDLDKFRNLKGVQSLIFPPIIQPA